MRVVGVVGVMFYFFSFSVYFVGFITQNVSKTLRKRTHVPQLPESWDPRCVSSIPTERK